MTGLDSNLGLVLIIIFLVILISIQFTLNQILLTLKEIKKKKEI